MSYRIDSGRVIEIHLPPMPSPAFTTAAAISRCELSRRLELTIDIKAGSDAVIDKNAALVIQLETLDSLPDDLQSRLNPPLQLAPYPDYAEHINIRTLDDRTPVTILLIGGSERALIFAVGMLLRGLRFEEDALCFEAINENYQPNTPLRGFSIQENQVENADDRQWEEWLMQSALWGNNLVGYPAGCLSPARLKQIREWSLYPCVRISADTDRSLFEAISYETTPFIWISPRSLHNDSLISPPQLLQIALDFHEILQDAGELWLDCGGYGEKLLTEFLDELNSVKESYIKALVCDPRIPTFDMIKREMPLTLQLITVSSLNTRSRDFALEIAEQYFACAPLTYGALAVASLTLDEESRFYWSLLSWSPQTPVDAMRDLYARQKNENPLDKLI